MGVRRGRGDRGRDLGGGWGWRGGQDDGAEREAARRSLAPTVPP